MGLFEYLKEHANLSFPDTKPDFNETAVERELGYQLPEDYKDIMRNCYCCSFMGEHDDMNILCQNDLYNFLDDDFWMVPLNGLLLFGGDNGGNWYAYDPNNRLGRGKFAVYFIDRCGLRFNEAKYIGANLTEAAKNILSADKGLWKWPNMEEEGFPQIENEEVPQAVVNNMEDLLKLIPQEINHKKEGQGVFEIKEDEGLITGHYRLKELNDKGEAMVLCHTWSRTYQGFYDAIAPALKMHGII